MENVREKPKMHLYDPKEENLNTISHGLGALLAFLGLVLMTVKIIKAEQLVVFSMMIFMLSMLSVYTFSMIYHGSKNLLHKRIWQKIDHAMVALIIAGTATPLLLVIASGPVATIMLSLIVIVTMVNIALNIICVQRFKKHSLVLYLLAVIFLMIGLFSNTVIKDKSFTNLILISFAVISVGGYFYMKKSLKYTHFIWHISNIICTSLLFFAFYFYVL